jgi:hypothetical protein
MSFLLLLLLRRGGASISLRLESPAWGSALARPHARLRRCFHRQSVTRSESMQLSLFGVAELADGWR